MNRKRMLIKFCILLPIYPLLRYLDTVIGPTSQLWRFYAHDLVMPGLYLLLGGLIVEALGFTRKGRMQALAVAAAGMLAFGISMEIKQGPPRGQVQDVGCYVVSLLLAWVIWFVLFDREKYEIYPEAEPETITNSLPRPNE
ncbi:hypothetical protein KKG41_05335 [Patescibacteria group bacterium]|nr:hypothetical protein [Patescibacteria group bacterium]MBU1890504.1 hypothetical protein [Patescibacteria group bacterium]